MDSVQRGLAGVAAGLLGSLFLAAVSYAGYDTEHVGEIYAVNVPHLRNWQHLALDQGKKLSRQYRWIYANASCKDLNEAKEEATKLSQAVGRPMILVYMSRHIFDQTRNEYPPRFHSVTQELVKAALDSGSQVLVSGRSYGVHQALRALRGLGSPRVLLTGIAPAFGAFGNTWSDNVNMYIQDVEHTRSKYCMIASKKDGFTWRSGGAAYRTKAGYRGDNDVGRAMEKNRSNVYTVRLDDADHAPIDEYLNHGLVLAMRQCAYHFSMTDTPLGVVQEDLGDEIFISDNEQACLDWCEDDPRCEKCSTLRGCGAGYDHLATWKGRGRNHHACAKRPSRSEASQNNQQACLDWCRNIPNCEGCSRMGDCGPGYEDIRSWTGRGDNWHACAKRQSREEASRSNRDACDTWCRQTADCVKCSKLGDCGVGYEDIRSWTGHGDNWHACARRESREQASQSNYQACAAWCRANRECVSCSRNPGCGMGKTRINSWTGRGENWYACRER